MRLHNKSKKYIKIPFLPILYVNLFKILSNCTNKHLFHDNLETILNNKKNLSIYVTLITHNINKSIKTNKVLLNNICIFIKKY